MKLLEYSDLNKSGLQTQYKRVIKNLQDGNFAGADVKKMATKGLYRAKLDDSNRLLFSLGHHQNQIVILVLDIIRNHQYEKSKFLRGAVIDEKKLQPFNKPELSEDRTPLVYINPNNSHFRMLDKIICFDPEQEDIYLHRLPSIVIGPAGSGKTAVILEKMKTMHGRILYVTLSPYLAENSRNIYYSHQYENEKQEINFLSFREFIETIRVPVGEEVSFQKFSFWYGRIPKVQRPAEAHRLYEEFRGVITGSTIDKAFLSRKDYLSLGVKQSIFLENERSAIYDFFEKYRNFLYENKLYDPNMLAFDYQALATPEYDYVVVDEVQDITNIQLFLILKTLIRRENFILCGDSNQIVHPNFFSWSQLKTMFYAEKQLEGHKITRILQSNFRNTQRITQLANDIIRIKHARFGAIDRESSYLMKSLSAFAGQIHLLKDNPRLKKEINDNTRNSTEYAVLVMRDEDKLLARQHFETPLLFSILEAKGLEYKNVILLNFISGEKENFQNIIDGVDENELNGTLVYKRAGDKRDKSLDIYKFFINSLYVGITRAVENLFILENNPQHPFIRPLKLGAAREAIKVESRQSNMEEWQEEARKLEMQGKIEQAEQIRAKILKTQPVPWKSMDEPSVKKLSKEIMSNPQIILKQCKLLFEYAVINDYPLILLLLSLRGYDKARPIAAYRNFKVHINDGLVFQQSTNLIQRDMSEIRTSNIQIALQKVKKYGVNYRSEHHLTPLMLAAIVGNSKMAAELIRLGADSQLINNHGLTAWQIAFHRALNNKKGAIESFARIHRLIAWPYIRLKIDDKLVKIDISQGEFLLYHYFYINLQYVFIENREITAPMLTEAFSRIPDSVIPAYRKKRTYISSLLSKNEIESSNPRGKKLFIRQNRGEYILNDAIFIDYKNKWLPVMAQLNEDIMEILFHTMRS
ncbi:MAG TPA: hypothetical protein ENN84_11285 [Candidatus Marinimicrobia bacterium]|nr:hypothetical protein [Candidatus Neomarinimicrobiota bacterium]